MTTAWCGGAGWSSLKDLQVVLQLEIHGLIYDAMDEVDEMGVGTEHGEEGVVVVAENNSLTRQQRKIIFCANVPEAGLVRQ